MRYSDLISRGILGGLESARGVSLKSRRVLGSSLAIALLFALTGPFLAAGASLAQDYGFGDGDPYYVEDGYLDVYADEYGIASTEIYEEEMSQGCFDTPEESDCDEIGATVSHCGEEFLCAAPAGTVAAGQGDPDFRECIDACLAEGLRKKNKCNADYRNDLAWCDREYRPGTWRHDTCYYLAGQTRNLCYAVEAAATAGCVSGCGIGAPVKGIWKKIK